MSLPCDIPIARANPALTIIIVTRNAGAVLGPCLASVSGFNDVRIVDSGSDDDTHAIARMHGRPVIDYVWDGCYPKKRQWCLNTLSDLGEWIFFLDADERVPTALAAAITRAIDPASDRSPDAYWICARPVIDGAQLHWGRAHAKISLFKRDHWFYPDCESLDDPAIQAIGDIEGHYQPCCRHTPRIGCLRQTLVHEWCRDITEWTERHARYAQWEAAFKDPATPSVLPRIHPADPRHDRLKKIYHALPMRSAVAFFDSFILCVGFLDGARGWGYAVLRARYARAVQRATRARAHAKSDGAQAESIPPTH